jgi:hypothetical protein
MPTLGNTPRPAYVYDTETDTWVPVGVGAHTHRDIPNTLVDAKGDLITATADNVPARLAKGADGTVLVSDSSTSTGLAWQPYAAPQVAGRNKFINGDLAINQRNFSSSTTNSAYNFDRWLFEYSSASTNTISAQTFTPGSAPVAGYEGINYVRLTSVANGGGYCAFIQKIEDVRTFAGQTITVSFWARAGSGTPKIGVGYTQVFGTGGSGINYNGAVAQTITTSWARYSFNLSIPSVAGKTIGPGNSLSIYPLVSDTVIANSVGLQSGTFDIWGLQAEVGSIATPFTTATGTIQGEIAACQRYYYRNTSSGGYGYMAGWGNALNSTATYLGAVLPVSMRVPPTAIDYPALSNFGLGDSQSTYTPTSIFLDTAQTNNNWVNLGVTVASGLTAYRSMVLRGSNTNNCYLGFSAEL